MAFLISLIFLPVGCASAYAGTRDSLHLSSGAYLLMEAGSGQVLLGKNAFSPRHPASTTKIITAIVVADYEESLPEVVVINEAAAFCPGSHMGLRPNERITVQSLLFGAMLPSGNDAASALAYHMAGSEEWFAWMMNRKARLLGATSATFCNPHGLTHPKHLASAHDLAAITRYALQNPYFRNAVARKSKVVVSVDGRQVHHLTNTNRLLWEWPAVSGVKTGTTDAAGKCLVASAESYPRELIAVVLRSGDRFGDVHKLLQFGFAEFDAVSICRGTLVRSPAGSDQEKALVTLRPFYWTFPISEAGVVEKRIRDGGAELDVIFQSRVMDKVPLTVNDWRLN